MEKIYEGKTKDVYKLPDGNILLQFKDDACGKDGVFDPGENQVGLTISGKGRAGLILSEFFFRRINAEGWLTHFIDCDHEKAQMTVRPATSFGNGIECICRYKAYGSFIRRFGGYIEEGTPLDSLAEITLKDDKRGDPFICEQALAVCGITTPGETQRLYKLTEEISAFIRDTLAEKGLELIDIKLEFGKDEKGNIMLIDEVSGDIMRVFRDGKSVDPIESARILTGDN
jgi:phosphoribosylaminoimidazole-succinocarboxamide synthase